MDKLLIRCCFSSYEYLFIFINFGKSIDMSDAVSMGYNPVTLLMDVIASIVYQKENTIDAY